MVGVDKYNEWSFLVEKVTKISDDLLSVFLVGEHLC